MEQKTQIYSKFERLCRPFESPESLTQADNDIDIALEFMNACVPNLLQASGYNLK